ncbi:MAG: hypothetical protein RMJ31_05835 [Nitrososphaerota archaeon]|nr:hypothetical protein [Nitrososphaerota archaeon]
MPIDGIDIRVTSRLIKSLFTHQSHRFKIITALHRAMIQKKSFVSMVRLSTFISDSGGTFDEGSDGICKAGGEVFKAMHTWRGGLGVLKGWAESI